MNMLAYNVFTGYGQPTRGEVSGESAAGKGFIGFNSPLTSKQYGVGSMQQ